MSALSPSRRIAVALVILPAFALSGCAVTQDATGFEDEKAKTHFVDACTESIEVEGTATTVKALASEDLCVCVFDRLNNENKLEWDEALTFEKSLARVDEDTPPEPPAQVGKAIDACEREFAEGPPAPKPSTTDQGTGAGSSTGDTSSGDSSTAESSTTTAGG